MAVFNGDDLLLALTPPTFVFGGVTYTGRILSLTEVLTLKQEFEAIQHGSADNLESAIETLRKLAVTMGVPADVLLSQPMPIIQGAVQHFFRSATGN